MPVCGSLARGGISTGGETVNDDFQNLQSALEDNTAAVEELREQVKALAGQLDELEKTIERLRRQMEH